MVSCPNCGRDLPRECICETSIEQKLDLYLKQAKREINLFKHILKGFKPKLQVDFYDLKGNIVGCIKTVPDEVEIRGSVCYVQVALKAPTDFSRLRTSIFDRRGRVLYWRMHKECGKEGDCMIVVFRLGIG